MSSKYIGVRHVETIEQLPKELEIGKAYFVDSEGYIVIDHGHGPIIYGNRPGPAGPASENTEFIQEQINHHTEAIINLLKTVQKMSNSYDVAINILAEAISKLYPESHSSEWEDDKKTTAEILTTEDGNQYKIVEHHLEDGAFVFQLETDETTAQYIAQTLKAGDKVQVNNSEWSVLKASVENGESIIVLELP